jgi:hypothetical protein
VAGDRKRGVESGDAGRERAALTLSVGLSTPPPSFTGLNFTAKSARRDKPRSEAGSLEVGLTGWRLDMVAPRRQRSGRNELKSGWLGVRPLVM